MRRAAFLTLLAALGAGVTSPAGRPAEASAVPRAYFRAATPEARERLLRFTAQELPGGIVCAAIPPAMLQTYSSSPGLTFLGYEQLYHPTPMSMEEPRPGAGPAAPGRPCPFPTFTPRVGWGIKTMYNDPQLNQPSGGAGVKVGVIDTGVAPHLDLVRRLVKCVDVTPMFDILPPCADSMNHGTGVASVIAADGGEDGQGMWGMAPEASIYSYRACEPNRECWGAYVAAGIYAAIADSVNIINMSLEGPGHDAAILEAIRVAVAHNILVIAAAGNYPFSYVAWPASYPEVVSVAAITQQLEAWPLSAVGFNDGDYLREPQEIEVSAPGVAILSARKDQCWGLPSGTSLASPLVAGLAAKLWNGSAETTRSRIQVGARLHDLNPAGDDPLTGFGLPTTAEFLRVTGTAGDGGVLSPGGTVPVEPGTNRSFTITPNNCYRILDVKVDGVSQGPITAYTFSNVTSDHAIEATFAASGPFTVTATAETGGTISPSGTVTVPCSSGRNYSIAAAGNCYSIKDVVVDGISRGPISGFAFENITADHTIHATFNALSKNPGPFVIQASAEAGGAISPSGSFTANCGIDRVYTVTANACYGVLDVRVDGVSVGAVTTYTFTNVRANHSIQATFAALGPYILEATANAGGTITPSGVSSIACGTNRTYTIAPADVCHAIQSVKVDDVTLGAVTSYTFPNVRTNHSIQVTFSPRGPFNITAAAAAGGSISPAGVSSTACGGSQSYTISPQTCYAIQNVKIDNISLGPISSYTFNNVTTAHTISATFVPVASLTITASAGAGGTISPAGASTVTCGSSRTYTFAPADNCHRIADVIVDGVSQGPIASYTFSSVNANHSIAATFSAAGPFTIRASAGAGGSIGPAGASSVACAGGLTYTITPADPCHVIQDVKVDGVSQGPVASYTFNMVTGDHSIDALFRTLTYTIQAGAGAGGTITPDGASSATCGDDRSYTIAPADQCHAIQNVIVDGVSRGPIASYTFANVRADHSIQATFAALGPFTIDASAGPGSAITPDGLSSVACGGSRTYTITPADVCRVIGDVRVDDASVGAVGGYTFEDVHADHTIRATSAPSSLGLEETHTGASWGGLADGEIDLTVTGGVPPYAYTWSNGATSQDIAALAAGAYEVIVTDAQGCSNRLSITIVNLGPAQMTLTRPAPNPTTGPLQMRYGIPAPSAVRLSVLDIHGREVAVLVNGTQPSGWSYANWNGRTREGQAPGGVYFIRLQAGGRQIVQRFALVR